MATSDKSRPVDEVPADLLPILKRSGLLTERQFEDVRKRVLEGSYPYGSRELATRLMREKILTEYQARRVLSNRPQGLVVGRYVIMDRIGAGSMGRVFKAHHQLMDRVVALKIIAPEIVSNERIVSRFQREMKLVGRLDHPNVVRAYDADQIGQTLYIVMEYVAGQSLGQKFRSEGPMPPLDVARYAAMAARGLAHAHDQAIVHRDVKPSNLLLNETGVVKVLDLGLGVLMEADEQATFATADGVAVGTIDYMSPEQATGREVDGRTDIYSLGCAMYHVISGRLPFPGITPIDRLGKRISGKPVPISDVCQGVPPDLIKIIDRMLANRPQDRFPTATATAEALESVGRPRAAAVVPKTPPPSPSAVAPARKPDSKPAQPVAAASAAAPPPPVFLTNTKTVTIRPTYPGWFQPLAQLAETTPAIALLVVLAGLLLSFGIGFAAALALR